MPVENEGVAAVPHGMWTTPTSSGMRPRPATIHEGFSYCVDGGYQGIPTWSSSALPVQQQQTSSDTVSSRPISVQQEYCSPTSMGNGEYSDHLLEQEQGLMAVVGQWVQKPMEDSLEIHSMDTDANIGHAYTTDESIPILELRYHEQPLEGDPMNFENGLNLRRMSGSSFTMSTSGGLSDITSYEDFSTALSDALSFTSEYPPPSNRTSLMSSTQLSPVASPRMTPQSRSELVRTQSRGRASPSPRPGLRSVPYSVETSRAKRWSTGTYGTMQNRRGAPFMYQHAPEACGPRMSSGHSSPTIQNSQFTLDFSNFQSAQQQQFFMGSTHPAAFQQHNSILPPSQLPSQSFHPDAQQFENPSPLLSHGLFRMLQSNADPHSLHGHYTDLADPPDLFAALHEEQIPPPPEDMNPSDPDMVPHEQEMRFDGDLYTPKWVRGHGNKREGWCGICKPGRWLVLKNSAFWYDKSFTHGISAATGQPFQEPQEMRRMDGNPDVWEGLCGSCNDWIALVNSKKKGTTWFRHAYKVDFSLFLSIPVLLLRFRVATNFRSQCHTHPKIKDAPKRRRESGHQRLAASTTAKPKVEPGQQLPAENFSTPLMTPASIATSTTPTPAQITSHPQHHQPIEQHQHQQQY